jgi:hypothetical protein
MKSIIPLLRKIKRKNLIATVFLCVSYFNSIGQNTSSPQNNAAVGINHKADSMALVRKTDSLNLIKSKKKVLCKIDSLTIDSIRGLGSLYNKNDNSFSIDEYMVVYIRENIDSLISANKKNPLMLWFNGIPFSNLTVWRANTTRKELIFSLICDTSSRSSWNTLTGYAYRNWFKAQKKVIVQIGTIDKCLSYEYKNDVYINVKEGWMMFWGYFFILCLICLFAWLIFSRRILQNGIVFDPSVKLVDKFSSGTHDNEVQRKDLPYSLSRSQLCFWIFIVASSIILIWLNMDVLAVVTTSTAYLIGISGGTSVVTKIIENNTNTKAATIKLTAVQFYQDYKSEGFFKDILTDGKGFSIARVQMLIFTLIIGFNFCWHVIYYLQMPILSEGILILMGISSSTYAGIKYNETA